METEKKLPKEIDPTVGRNIRHLRVKKGLNLADLANAVDSDVGNISRLERAKQGYSDEMIRKIADFFERPVSDLFRPDLPFENLSPESDAQPTRLKASVWEDGAQDSEEFVEIPLIDVHFSAGDGSVEIVEKEEFALIFRRIATSSVWPSTWRPFFSNADDAHIKRRSASARCPWSGLNRLPVSSMI